MAANPKSSLAKHLKPSLGMFEITVYTAYWAFGIIYSIFHVYKASRLYYRKLVVHELEPGWFGAASKWRKDVSDSEWLVFGAILFDSIPFFVVHFVGSQFLRRIDQPRSLPTFYALFGAVYLYRYG